MSCCNCSAKLRKEYAVKEITISLLNDQNDDGDAEIEEDGVEGNGPSQSMSIKEALTSIFGSAWTCEILIRRKSDDLWMCYRCADSLGSLYQAYINFVQCSVSSSCLSQWISQIKQSHKRCDESINVDPLSIESSFLNWKGGEVGSETYHSESEHDMKPAVEDFPETTVECYDLFEDDAPISTRLRRGGCNSDTSVPLVPPNNIKPLTVHLLDDNKTRKTIKPKKRKIEGEPPIADGKHNWTSRFSNTKSKKSKKSDCSDSSLFKPREDNLKYKTAERSYAIRREKAYQRASCKFCPLRFPFFWMANFHTLLDHENVVPMQCTSCSFEYFDSALGVSHICQEVLPKPKGYKRCTFCGDAVLKFNYLSHGFEHDKEALPPGFEEKQDVTSLSSSETKTRLQESCDSEDTLYKPPRDFSKPKTVRSSKAIPKEIAYQRAPCNLCPLRFPFSWMAHFHTLQVHENTPPMKCDQCSFEYFDSAQGDSHICRKVAPKSKSHKRCSFCGDAVPKFYFLSHGLKHDGEETGIEMIHCTAPGCTKTFGFQSRLETHIRKYHMEDGVRERMERAQVQCDECGKVFSRQSKLTIHMNIHAETGKYVCSFCGLTFKVPGGLGRHIRNVHLGTRKYQCPLCKLGFKTSSSLKAHFQCKAHSPEEKRDLLTKNIEEFKIKETDDIIVPNRKSDKPRRAWGTNRLLNLH